MKTLRLIAVLLLFSSSVQAAPPALTWLYPAGAKRGSTVEVTAGGNFAHWPIQTWTSDRGVSFKALPAKGKLSVTVGADVMPGVCWIRLHDAEGPSALKPFIIGALPEVMEQEPNDDARKPQLINRDCVVNGKLAQPGDVDCFGVRLRKGQTLVADVEANDTLKSPLDGVLQVLSAEGGVLKENNDDHGLDPRIIFVAPADGLFVVRLYAFPAEPDSSIRFAGAETYVYRLTLTTGPFADHAWPLVVSRKEPGEVKAIGWNLPAESRLSGKPGDEDELTLFEPRFIRPVKVRVEPHPCVVEQEPNDRKRPQSLAWPITVSGRIEPAGNVDVYRVEAKKGQPMQFEIEAHALGFPLDPVLRLTDATGKLLLEQDDNGMSRDATLSYTPSADGVLHIEVRDLHGHGGPRYAYRLRIVRPEPTFALVVKPDLFKVTPGKPVDVSVTIERKNGFKDEIAIEALDLPAGVTAIPIQTSGPSAMVKVTAEKPAQSGGFRIVGRSAGKQRLTGYLWVDVSAK
jgi:hypothetical protein